MNTLITDTGKFVGYVTERERGSGTAGKYRIILAASHDLLLLDPRTEAGRAAIESGHVEILHARGAAEREATIKQLLRRRA